MLYAPERQVDARLCDPRLLWYLVPEVLLRAAGHDQQATVGQPFRKRDGAVLSPEQEEAIRTGAINTIVDGKRRTKLI